MHSHYSKTFLGWAIADTYRNGGYFECKSFVLTDSSARDRVIKRCEGLAMLLYGAETATSLEVNCVDATGNRHVLQFDETALRQLAHVVRQIDVKLPGALKGH